MYPRFRTQAAAKKAFKRCRKDQWFILENTNQNPKCAHCGNPIFDYSGHDEDGQELHKEGYRNNRCVYVPRIKKIIAMHYVCTWKAALETIIQKRAA